MKQLYPSLVESVIELQMNANLIKRKLNGLEYQRNA